MCAFIFVCFTLQSVACSLALPLLPLLLPFRKIYPSIHLKNLYLQLWNLNGCDVSTFFSLFLHFSVSIPVPVAWFKNLISTKMVFFFIKDIHTYSVLRSKGNIQANDFFFVQVQNRVINHFRFEFFVLLLFRLSCLYFLRFAFRDRNECEQF